MENARLKAYPFNPAEPLVSGYWYRVVMTNGMTETFWTPRKPTRKQVRQLALDYVGRESYGPEDIESVRKLKGAP